MSDTGDSGTMSDTGDGSVLSDWSVVDQHGELPDDDTASTTSSVEIVDDDEDDTAEHSTPVAGSPSSVMPRFVLRIPSHEHDASDNDEDPVSNPRVSHMLDDHTDAGLFGQLGSSKPPPILSKGLDAGQTYRQSTAIARVSMEELDELRQTLDLLKKNLQPSTVDDSSPTKVDNSSPSTFDDSSPTKVDNSSPSTFDNSTPSMVDNSSPTKVVDGSLSSNEMFGEGRSDDNGVPMKMPADELLSQGPMENIGNHGDVLCDDVSMASSVSSSYSFLSKDAGTNCSLLTETIDDVDVNLTSPDDHQTQLERTANQQFPADDQLEKQEDDFPMEVVHEKNGLKKFILIMSEFQVQFIVLAGLICYTGLVIQMVLFQGPVFQEQNAFSSCPRYNVELPSNARDFTDDYSCHHGNDSSDIAEDIGHYNTSRDKEIESLKGEIERLKKQDKDAPNTTVQVTFTLIRNDMDHSHIKSDISEYEFTKEIVMMLQDKEEQFKLLLKKSNEITDKIRNAQRDFMNLTDELVAIKDEKEKTKLSMGVETDPQEHECQGLMDKQAELYSENERLQGMLIESRTRSTDWKLYLENAKHQSERELYDVRRQCKTDLDRLRKQLEADVQLSRGQFARNTEQTKGHSGKEEAGAQPNTEKEDNQSKNRNGKSSDSRKRDENQSTNDGQSEKGSYSSGNSQDENYSGRMLADTVLDMMNKTRGQIQDTWAKVKNMSESMWTKHKPIVHRLQDAFTRKLQNLSTRFHEKLMRKMNKWFPMDKKHEQQQNDVPNAHTKRRQFNVHDHTIKSDVTVKSRLVKLSQKVAELNARKFKKWRHGPKIVDIQREFNDVDLIAKRGPIMNDNDHWGTDSHLRWFQCQLQWWKTLAVVTITDDCYQALCCWQVKVTGGDVKQCRRVKRKLGMVEDMCTPEHASKYMKHDQEKQRYKPMSTPTNDEDHHETPSEANSYSQNIKDEMEEDRHGEAHNQFFRHKNNNAHNAKDGKQNSAGVDDEVNWFLDMGEDREYHRGEPDNWFFRRNDKKVSADETKSWFTSPDIDLDDSDFEDENYYENLDL